MAVSLVEMAKVENMATIGCYFDYVLCTVTVWGTTALYNIYILINARLDTTLISPLFSNAA